MDAARCRSTIPYKLSGWKFITTSELTMPTVDQIKTAIYTYGPITAGFALAVGGVVIQAAVFSTEEKLMCGGYTNHQIILTGWDDSHRNLDPAQ